METVCTVSGRERPRWDTSCYRNVLIWAVLRLLREPSSEQTSVVVFFCDDSPALSLALRLLSCEVDFEGALGHWKLFLT